MAFLKLLLFNSILPLSDDPNESRARSSLQRLLDRLDCFSAVASSMTSPIPNHWEKIRTGIRRNEKQQQQQQQQKTTHDLFHLYSVTHRRGRQLYLTKAPEHSKVGRRSSGRRKGGGNRGCSSKCPEWFKSRLFTFLSVPSLKFTFSAPLRLPFTCPPPPRLPAEKAGGRPVRNWPCRRHIVRGFSGRRCI